MQEKITRKELEKFNDSFRQLYKKAEEEHTIVDAITNSIMFSFLPGNSQKEADELNKRLQEWWPNNEKVMKRLSSDLCALVVEVDQINKFDVYYPFENEDPFFGPTDSLFFKNINEAEVNYYLELVESYFNDGNECSMQEFTEGLMEGLVYTVCSIENADNYYSGNLSGIKKQIQDSFIYLISEYRSNLKSAIV